jgi:hypothetical protein
MRQMGQVEESSRAGSETTGTDELDIIFLAAGHQ